MVRQAHISRLSQLSKRGIAAGILLCGLIFTVNLFSCRLESPAPTVEVVDRTGQFICEVRDGGDDAEKGYWQMERVPDRVHATVLAVEDHRFYMHPGVDPISIIRAVYQNITNGYRVSGASTIAMQVVRLQRPATRTYGNKLREMLDAVCLTARFGRSRIMNQYLTVAPYGNGIRGLGYASRCYFDKPVEDLSWAEIAFLCAIPQQPNRMNPRTPRGRVQVVKRARNILATVAARNMMTSAELHRAMDQVASLTIEPRRKTPENALHLALRYRNGLSRVGQSISILIDTDTASSPLMTTAIDLELQDFIFEQTRLCLETWDVAGARNAAAMVIDSKTLEVVSLIGSRDYFDTDRAGAIDYTAVRRSPGSTLKPFIYALAIENGVVSPNGFIRDDLQRAGGFRNFDHIWLGQISVGNALASSRNIPAVNLLRRTGIHRAFGCFADLQLHEYEASCDQFGLGMAIGGLPVSMEMLARAYTVFVNGGRLGELRWERGSSGFVGRQIFSQATVDWIGSYLSNPADRLPSFPRMGNLEYDYPVAVKTGTSEGCRDAWTVAWSSNYLTLVWLGRPDGQAMNGVGGYKSAAALARVIMDKLHEDHRLNPALVQPFNQPDQVQHPPEQAPLSASLPGTIESQEPVIRITSPENAATYYFNPETPATASTLLLTVDIPEHPWARISWFIDGNLFRSCYANESTYWAMTPGTHAIVVQVRDFPEVTDQSKITIRAL